jgi:hypothetical protein
MTPTTLFFPPRFAGPPGAANGGIACGSLAVAGGGAEVRLHRPVPLGRPLDVRHEAGAVVLEDAGELLARVLPGAGPELSVPDTVSAEEAAEATRRSSCHTHPVFPDCFGCGPNRADGLRIFPGRVPGRRVWAAPWTPDPSVAGPDGRVAPEVVWAALDCPSGFAAVEGAELPRGSAAVLGQMSARIADRPAIGVEHRIVARPIAVDGRKLTAASALLAPDGEVLAAASTIWLVVPAPVGPPAGAARSAR